MTSGLVTEPGTWSRDEESLAEAINVDLSSPGIIAKRRGFSNNTLNSFSGVVWAMHSSQTLERDLGTGALLLAVGDPDLGPFGFRVGTRASTFAAIAGTFDSDGDSRPKLATLTNSSDVITTWSTGGFKGLLVPNYSALTARYLGVPRGMGVDRLVTATSGVTGFLPAAYSCRYAVTFSLGDPTVNGTQEGAPGMTSVFNNTTVNAVNVTVGVLLPRLYGTVASALDADAFWVSVYRSVGAPATLGEPPSELALVYRARLSAADIAAGAISFTDIVPDQARGASLYTNLLTGEDGISGRGFINSNEPPPAARDVATWADCLWLGYTEDFPSQEVQLISVGGTGLVAGDTFTVDGVAFTAIAGVPVPPADNFQLFTTGTASVNQRETALNLCDAINRSVNNSSCWAFYVAGVVGQPGRIILRARTMASNLSAATSRSAAFRIATEDANNPAQNGIAFSKQLQPHAHPVVNRFELGRGDAEVMRIIPYRDSLFVFKADGLWRVTGVDFRSFEALEFDLTFRLLSRESVVALDDAIYAWGVRGLARITDGGVEYIDAPIRNDVSSTMSSVLQSSMEDYSFALARPRDGVVVFFYPTNNPSDMADPSYPVPCARAYAWHARSQTWARWQFTSPDTAAIGYLCGTANVVDALSSLGVWQEAPASGCYVHNERRAYTAADFTDPNMSVASAPTMAALAVAETTNWRPLGAASLGAAQWVRVRMEFAAPDATRQAQSAAVLLGVRGDAGSEWQTTATPGVLPVAFGPGVAVWPVDQNAARSHAFQVSVVDANAAGLWIVGLTVDYRDVSRRGVTR